MAGRALESRAQFGINPIKAGRDHDIDFGGIRCRPRHWQDGKTNPAQPSEKRSQRPNAPYAGQDYAQLRSKVSASPWTPHRYQAGRAGEMADIWQLYLGICYSDMGPMGPASTGE